MAEKKPESNGYTYDKGRIIGPFGPQHLMEDLDKKRAAERTLFRDTPVLPPDKRDRNKVYPWDKEKPKE